MEDKNKKIEFSATDSIIFDMDGTLWNAIDSYATVWNESFKHFGIDFSITGADLLKYMGMPIDIIFNELLSDKLPVDKKTYLECLDKTEDRLMPIIGGVLYDGVREGIERLAKHYKLFMISNCGVNGLKIFMKYNGFENIFVDSLTYGETNLNKSGNIKTLINRYGLDSAVYVGDTQGDCDETHKAGIKFVYASYGFGNCVDADIEFDNFNKIVDYFVKLKK